MAQGTNLIFFVPTCVVAIIINLKNKNIQKKTALIISCAGIVGAIIGAEISTMLDINILKKSFGVFLIIMAFFEFYSLINLHIKSKKVHNKVR